MNAWVCSVNSLGWEWVNYFIPYFIMDVISYPWSWWRHQMETLSALLAVCEGNSPVTGEFHAQRPVTRSFDVFFDLCLYKRLSKQSWGWRFKTPSRPLWLHRNVVKKGVSISHQTLAWITLDSNHPNTPFFYEKKNLWMILSPHWPMPETQVTCGMQGFVYRRKECD